MLLELFSRKIPLLFSGCEFGQNVWIFSEKWRQIWNCTIGNAWSRLLPFKGNISLSLIFFLLSLYKRRKKINTYLTKTVDIWGITKEFTLMPSSLQRWDARGVSPLACRVFIWRWASNSKNSIERQVCVWQWKEGVVLMVVASNKKSFIGVGTGHPRVSVCHSLCLTGTTSKEF